MTDEELLTKYLQTKDHELFAVLDERMRPRLYRLALRLLKSPDDAEDIVQDTLCKLLELEPREFYPPAENFLFRILQNLCIDQGRAKEASVWNGMESLDSITESDNYCADTFPDKDSDLTEAQVRARELQNEARVALDDLIPNQKEAVELCHCQDMTASEAAELLGISDTAVEMRAKRGIKNLRKHFDVKTQPRVRPVRATDTDGKVVHEFSRLTDAIRAGYYQKPLNRALKLGTTYKGLNWSYATAV